MRCMWMLGFGLALALAPSLGDAHGHGLGLDRISSIDVQGREISVTVEMPSDAAGGGQITITATDDDTRENVSNVTFLIGMFYGDEMIFRNYFFAEDGVLQLRMVSEEYDGVVIRGEQDSLLGAYHAAGSLPVELAGDVFDDGGLYTFEIEIRTIEDPANIIEDSEVHTADLSVLSVSLHDEEDSDGNDVQFRLKSYFDRVESLEYDHEAGQVTFEVPFDWRESRMSHIPVVHEEVQFPKGLGEFFAPSYTGYANGIKLFKASVTIDDYTEIDDRIVHFVLLQDHLRFLKSEMKKSGEPLPDSIVFTLVTSDTVSFPLTAYTRSEDFQVNLSWDPVNIEPGVDTDFVFTIRDGATGEPLRNSDYTFVILQNGQEIHRTSGTAQVGGGFEEFEFAEDQTGPTVIRFEDIRNSGQETEFGVVVTPEFEAAMLAILAGSMAAVIAAGWRLGLMNRPVSLGAA